MTCPDCLVGLPGFDPGSLDRTPSQKCPIGSDWVWLGFYLVEWQTQRRLVGSRWVWLGAVGWGLLAIR